MHEWYLNCMESLQDVCDTAPEGTIIHLPIGTFRQKLTIRTPNLTLIGAGADKTRIVFDDCARKYDVVGRPLGTFRSFTVAVTAAHVAMRDLTIENDAGAPQQNGQQVALSVYGDAFEMIRCALISTQDTLFLGPLPPDLRLRYRDLLPESLRRSDPLSSSFTDCTIAGSVDFIFGGGDAAFNRCILRSVADGHSIGYVAAPSHALGRTQGFLFDHCVFECGADVLPNSVFLARPWRDHGLVTIIDCAYDTHIRPEGFDPWGTTNRDQTARFFESPAIPSRVPWCRLPE